MTPLDLQDALCSELRTLFSDDLFRNSLDEYVPIKVFSQNLPIEKNDDDEDPVPYIIVRLNNGDDDGKKDSNNVVNLVIIIGVCENMKEQQGYRDVMHVFQKIYQRFQEKPKLGDQAVFNGEFHWANQEDGYYPYFFGACTLSFNIPAIRRVDPFA